ncbi:MAG: hypothetical protein LUF33_00030 [Clostridiales bacterium]|nr:hypothetical protein [Clostridiales bacterium]
MSSELEVNSKTELNFGTIKQLQRGAQTALEMTTDALLTEVKNAQVMPFDTGSLQNENTFADYSSSSDGVTSLVSTTPYARRLYYHPEYSFHRDENAAAGGLWYDQWLKGGARQNFCSDTFAKLFKRVTGV